MKRFMCRKIKRIKKGLNKLKRNKKSDNDSKNTKKIVKEKVEK